MLSIQLPLIYLYMYLSYVPTHIPHISLYTYISVFSLYNWSRLPQNHGLLANLPIEVEQEREVQIEVETVREVKKPLQAAPITQQALHKDVKLFAENGRLVGGSQAYEQVFIALRKTALGRQSDIADHATKSRLFVTRDFSNVVTIEWGKPLDEYSRPVHWILWSPTTDTALIVSDFEADSIIPLIRDRDPASTHLITYAAPVTRSMLVFDTLNLYTVPSLPANWRAPTWLVRDLGIFAGRLYFDFKDQARAVYQSLGLPPPPPASINDNDPFNKPSETDLWHELPFDDGDDSREDVHVKGEDPSFCRDPLLFMQEWLAVRRKGQDFSQSMVGQLVRGRRLEEVNDEGRGVEDRDVERGVGEEDGGEDGERELEVEMEGGVGDEDE